MKLVLASRNPHKLAEIRQIFSLPGVEWAGLDAFADMPDVVEDGTTFAANAVKKAVSVALHCREWSIADDSGLEVKALNGAPGVMSARYAGEPPDYAANNDLLLRELTGHADRTARFCCTVALSAPDGRAQIVAGVCRGRILNAPRGQCGFGYDPLFVPDGYDMTFAEMDSGLKNRISHRALALQAAAQKWSTLLRGTKSKNGD